VICERLGEGLYRPHIEQAFAGLAVDAEPHSAGEERDRSRRGPR
jgi:hypothetical protein